MEKKRIAEVMLEGIPKEVADFYADCLRVVRRVKGGQVSRVRIVILHSVRGASSLISTLIRNGASRHTVFFPDECPWNTLEIWFGLSPVRMASRCRAPPVRAVPESPP